MRREDSMHNNRSTWLILLPALLAMSACHGTPAEAPAEVPAAAPAAPVAARVVAPAEPRAPIDELRRREAVRTVEYLEAMLVANRQAVVVGEEQLQQLRVLHAAGRVGTVELGAMETEVLDRKRELLRHERELADARAVVAGAGR